MNIYELSERKPKNKKSIVFITDQDLFKLQNQLQTLTKKTVRILPGFDILPYDSVSPSYKIMLERVKTLAQLSDTDILLTNPMGLLWRLPEVPLSKPLILKVGDVFSRELLEDFLKTNLYERVDIVRNPGEYAIRGRLIDVFESQFYRIDFFDDVIDSLKTVDFLSQRTINLQSEITLHAMHELGLIPRKPKFAPKDHSYYEITSKIEEGIHIGGFEFFWPLFVAKSHTLPELIDAEFILDTDLKEAYHQAHSFYKKYHGSKNILEPDALYWTQEEITAFLKTVTKVAPESKDFEPFKSIEDFKAAIAKITKPIIIACDTEAVMNRMQEIFEEHDIPLALHKDFPGSKELSLHRMMATVLPIDKGFETKDYVLFSDQQVLGKNYFGSRQKRKANYNFFKKNFEMTKGDIVVHEYHGVGQFDKLETVVVNHISHECIRLLYHKNERLYVPVEYFDLITLYGSHDDSIALDSLGSTSFKKRKNKAKTRINEMAKYLIDIAAQRKMQYADALHYDTEAYDAFCHKFPYVLTEDQEKAMDAIMHDLNSGHLMDRLICADPGFGKTEMALRAAYLVLASGKQVVILTPTTTLAQQHYNLCKERFENYNVVQVSRFVSPRELKIVMADITSGKAQLIIGTHSLLSDRIKFPNLGLLVVDEEHHFGVGQKEKLKKNYKDVHMLALSATPIPRTLQMSLSGIKEMSLIGTPPINRLPIHTDVGPFDEVKFQDLVSREYHRGGQIFFVAPRISMLSDMKDIVKRLFPKMRVVTIHGGLEPDVIEQGLGSFEQGSYDMMLATHIIEAGLNLPRANTMIIYHANKFGLAQLYQLRGRVGRTHIQAYAYLTYASEDDLTANVVRRLNVLKSLEQLGVGFSIATHDMDIRGYGNIVGEEQSGHIKDIGVELYQRMLEDALSATQNNGDLDFYPHINLKLNVLIPEDYIAEPQIRLALYKALSDVRTRKDLEQYRVEVEDRFGKIPPSFLNLIHIVDLKILCKQAYIQKLEEVPQGFFIKFYKPPQYKKMQTFLNDPWSRKYVDIAKDQGFLFKVKPDWKVLKGVCLKLKEFIQDEVPISEEASSPELDNNPG